MKHRDYIFFKKINAEIKVGIEFLDNISQETFMTDEKLKLKENGSMAIIQNGSSLFTGDAGSGPS